MKLKAALLTIALVLTPTVVNAQSCDTPQRTERLANLMSAIETSNLARQHYINMMQIYTLGINQGYVAPETVQAYQNARQEALAKLNRSLQALRSFPTHCYPPVVQQAVNQAIINGEYSRQQIMSVQ